MKAKSALLVIISSILVVLACPVASGADTREIDRVRDKSVLGPRDFEIIEQFISEAVGELVNNKDFTSVARLRTIIVTRKDSKVAGQSQCAEQFSKYARKYIAEAFKKSESIDSAAEQVRVRLNLMILVDELRDSRLIETALEGLADDSPAVRYWAIHALTRGGLLTGLEPGSEQLDRVVTRLENACETACPEELVLMIDYAGASRNSRTDKLLLKIADMRISEHAKWKVETGHVDIRLLKQLAQKATGKTTNDEGAFGVRFSQLYSYIMQKYIMHLNGGGFLSDEQRLRTASVMERYQRSLASITDKITTAASGHRHCRCRNRRVKSKIQSVSSPS
jgi:hypothetical protein